MNYKRQLPSPKNTRVVWVYWVSRDSLNGELRGRCSLWRARPMRVHHKGRVVWVGANDHDPGYLGEYDTQTVFLWFHVYPETDRELVRVEQNATEKMIEHAKELKAKRA